MVMSELELRRLAQWDRQQDAVSSASSRLAEANREAREAALTLSALTRRVRQECPVALDDLEYRFWSKVTVVDDETSCWEWEKANRGIEGEMYGQFRIEGEVRGAHRVAYLLVNGCWPDITRHRCDNPICVRPSHLDSGTHLDNMQDRSDRNRNPKKKDQRGEANCSSVLTDSIVIEARRRVRNGESIAALARDLGVPRPSLGYAVRGQTWSHLNGIEPPATAKRGSLSWEQVKEIREAKGRENAQDLAERYEVTRDAIWYHWRSQ